MGWINPAGAPTCGFCCELSTYDVRLGFADATVGLFALCQSAVLVGSMLVLLYRLNRTYRSSYEAHQLPMRRLLRAAMVAGQPRGATSKRSRGVLVLPVYYTYTQCAALLFIVEALLYMPANSTAVNWLRFISFAACAFFDNFVVAFLALEATVSRPWRSAALSAAVSACYLVYVSLLPTSADCAWCGVHFPKPGIEYAYIVAAAVYVAIGGRAAGQRRSQPAGAAGCGFRPRPAASAWCFTLAFAYGVSAIGLLGLDQWGLDAGFCLIDSAILQYSVMYAPMLYKTFIADTAFGTQADALQVLEALRTPLVSAEPTHSHKAPVDAATDGDLRGLLSDTSVSIIPAEQMTLVQEVGVGGYGSVHRAKWRGTDVAVKRLFVLSNTAGGGPPLLSMKEFLREARLLAGLRHPNVVMLLGLCLDEGNQSIVTEYVDGPSVFDALRSFRRQLEVDALRQQQPANTMTPLPTALDICVQCCSGMAYLHSRTPAVIHRDLKSPNLLINARTGAVKVCDFGLSRCKQATATMTAIGTCQWTAPEVLRRDAYSEKADVWSFGVIVWELCALALPFGDMSAVSVAAGVAYNGLRLVPPPAMPALLRSVMERCFHDDPSCRPSFVELTALLAQGDTQLQ